MADLVQLTLAQKISQILDSGNIDKYTWEEGLNRWLQVNRASD